MIGRRPRVLRCIVVFGLLAAAGGFAGRVEAARKSRLLKKLNQRAKPKKVE